MSATLNCANVEYAQVKREFRRGRGGSASTTTCECDAKFEAYTLISLLFQGLVRVCFAGEVLEQANISARYVDLWCTDDELQSASSLILERKQYVGELITEEEVQRRKNAQDNLEYLFGLANNYCLDALREGNLTRYMNHPDYKSQLNVRAAVIRVDGDPRVAFIAKTDIPANTEVRYFFPICNQLLSFA